MLDGAHRRLELGQQGGASWQVKPKLKDLLVILAGLVLGQVLLYGPSFCGRKILLPLDILAAPKVYLPQTPAAPHLEPANRYLEDLVFHSEPMRRFGASELHAGRLPLWVPSIFAGAPFIEAKFSPFAVLHFCISSPVVLAWSQMSIALVAGLGAYGFFRRVLNVGFWPAAISAWCYPLTGFFIFWQGYPLTPVVCWLPWLLLAVHGTARGTNRLAALGLSVVTALVLVSGHLDIAAQSLLASGLFAIWCWLEAWRKHWFAPPARSAALALAAGWALGLLLAAPHVLPFLEYTHTGARMVRRIAGEEDRPPVGLKALPQVVLPDMYGAYGAQSAGNFRFAREVQLESSAAAYTGLIGTLLVAPLAWCSRRHRSINLFWLIAALFGLSWCLDLPGFVSLLRLPGLNLMSHNRLVFVASFAILSLTAVGLEVFLQGPVSWKWWLWIAPGLLAALGAWCVCSALFLPEPVATQLARDVARGTSYGWIHDLGSVSQVQARFVQYYVQGAAWCCLGLLGWLLVRSQKLWQARLFPALAAALVVDLLCFAQGRSVQCAPALYYPPIPVVDFLAKSAPGRIIGFDCLPPNLAVMCGLRDVRGYDAVDPARMVELLGLAADPASAKLSYASTLYYAPKVTTIPDGSLRLSPILDMLNVRYVLFRGAPSEGARPAFQAPDYWVMENPAALPRVFIPRHVELVTDKDSRLKKLASTQFDAREVALVEDPIQLPEACRGAAEIVDESAVNITIAVRMETPGLLVLADRWDKGWQARLNGQPAPILITDHALRGVVVPAGSGTLQFRYAPSSFAWGVKLCLLAAFLLLARLVALALSLPSGAAGSPAGGRPDPSESGAPKPPPL